MWHHLQYLVGLERLGHQVIFCEHFGWENSCYDPNLKLQVDDPQFGIKALEEMISYLGLTTRWCYISANGQYFGMTRSEFLEVCRECDLYIDISNVNQFPEMELCNRKVLVDTDPVFTQSGIHGLTQDFSLYDHCFTFGENVNLVDCKMPSADTDWIPTRQPVVLDLWQNSEGGYEDGPFTTITSWTPFKTNCSMASQYGQKDRQFEAILELPTGTSHAMELATAPPEDARRRLEDHGWKLVDPQQVAGNPMGYMRYLRSSRGEFSVAKHGYVVTQCGWFSERSACYMASGLPVVLEDTGFSSWLPVGEGVLTFRSLEEALHSINRLNEDYKHHCRAAKQLASEHFESGRVLSRLLEIAMSN